MSTGEHGQHRVDKIKGKLKGKFRTFLLPPISLSPYRDTVQHHQKEELWESSRWESVFFPSVWDVLLSWTISIPRGRVLANTASLLGHPSPSRRNGEMSRRSCSTTAPSSARGPPMM